MGGVDWPRPELPPGTVFRENLETLGGVAREEARMVHEHGGNLLRVFYSMAGVLHGDAADLELVIGQAGPGPGPALYSRSIDERAEGVDRCAVVLDGIVTAVEGGSSPDFTLDLSVLDAYLGGVEEFNAGAGGPDSGVRVLLTLVAPVPRWIIEAPSAATLASLGRGESFQSLWARLVRAHASLHRTLVRRYVAERAAPALAALEIGNEPDYVWTPEEVKIENSSDPLVYPLSKYVTELHLPQVPDEQASAPAFDGRPWGYADQDAEWRTDRTPNPTPALEFDWGEKFDWYVKCFADFQQAVADATREEADAHGVELDIVSASVTHNNVDYLARMQRANPRAFASTNKIGIHPYHWPRNDVWDTEFVGGPGLETWTSASPREFAGSYYKRFDFLEQMAALVGRRGPRASRSGPRMLRDFARAVAGKKLWITEFGFGSKVLGTHNAPVAEYTRFIRPRGQVGAAAGEHARGVGAPVGEVPGAGGLGVPGPQPGGVPVALFAARAGDGRLRHARRRQVQPRAAPVSTAARDSIRPRSAVDTPAGRRERQGRRRCPGHPGRGGAEQRPCRAGDPP